ncbi:MAG TPA: 50S ribosomal protein L29 [Vicinamibacteria bacterium]|nr:50S ribosomal protein L29 [Vicinamibacteria bacterium]
MKIEKIRELGAEELRGRASELLEEIFRARMQKETGQPDQSVKLKSLKRDLARVKTVLREIGLAEARAPRESEG